MTNKLLAAIIGAGLCFTVGCVSNKVSPLVTDFKHPVYPDVVKALQKKDYEMLSSYMSNELRVQFSEKHFQALLTLLDKGGEIESIEYLGYLQHPLYASELWKIRVVRINRDNEKIFLDKLLQLAMKKSGNKIKIGGLLLK